MSADVERLDPELARVLSAVVDPELGIDVIALGLVYRAVREGPLVRVDLTMTSPACPMAETILDDAHAALEALPGVERAEVELVFEPRWSPERMTEEAKRRLGIHRAEQETP